MARENNDLYSNKNISLEFILIVYINIECYQIAKFVGNLENSFAIIPQKYQKIVYYYQIKKDQSSRILISGLDNPQSKHSNILNHVRHLDPTNKIPFLISKASQTLNLRNPQ